VMCNLHEHIFGDAQGIASYHRTPNTYP
jgi:hypothetical protein